MSDYINKIKTSDGQEYSVQDERVKVIYTEAEKAKLARMQEVFTTQEKMKLDSTEIFTVAEKEKLAGSASTADVEALSQEINTKASASDVTVLQENVTKLEGDLSGFEQETTQALTAKQDTLVSGSNIKTINNNAVLGSGNINIIPSGISYISTAPASDNTDGDLKFVILSAEPATRYNGYLYIITGSAQ